MCQSQSLAIIEIILYTIQNFKLKEKQEKHKRKLSEYFEPFKRYTTER